MAKNLDPIIIKPNDFLTGEHWAIIIGISNYQDSNLNLQFAHKDAEDLYNLLIKSNGGPFKEDHIIKLINEDATQSKIIRALRKFLKKPDENDLVLIYFSCHGAYDPDRPKNSYILPYDTDRDDIASTAVPMREIESSIYDNLLSKKIIIIADACHSAAIGGEMRRRNITSTTIINKFLEELAKSKEGTALLTSAEANEVAFEDKKWGDGHGVFTHFLLEGLRGKADGYAGGKKDGIITIGELFEYVRHNVKENTENNQHPSIGSSRFDRNLPLYVTDYILDSQTDSSSSISFSPNQERLEYILNLLQNGQVNDFNNLRKNDNNNQPIYLPNIDLSDKNLLGIDLHESILSQSRFKKTKMRGANLTGAILTKADLTEADLRSADLTGAKLDGAKLVNVQLRGADLKGMVDFSNADLTGADLRGVDLDGMVNFEGAILHNVNFEGSNIDKVDKVLLRLNGADIKNVNGLPRTLEPSNKYLNALKQFSEHISDLFNRYHISVDYKKIVEESIKQLVKDVESLQSLETIKNREKGNLQIKIKSLIQKILKVLPLEIQQQISESFLILTPLNEFLDKSSNITINQLVEYEIQRNKSAKDSGKTNEYKLKNYVTNRRAIIIGINRYESTLTIPSLEGAENDAIEISDRLSYNAGFQISDKDYLLGSNATRKNILKAFNDVFRNNSDLVLFYFSGYIIIDKENNKVYLASYDIDPEDPFGSGIKIEDLNNVIYKSKNKASLIIILDCCYARIATQDTKKYDTAAGVENESLKNIYVDNLYKIIRDDNRLASVTSETSIEGKIILASSEATAVSRERHDCKHINSNDPPHSHGAFSFHLLEGLDGKAADPDTGFITIHTLKKYIENQMLAEQRQKPIYCIAEAWKIENIIIAVSQQQFNTKISSLIRDTKDLLAIKDPNNNFVDIRKIEEAVRKIKELINLDPKNKEIPKLQTIIDDSLNMYKQPVIEWLGNNMMVARLKINEIKSDLYDYELPDLFDSLSFNELSKIEKSKLAILIHLSSEVKRNTKFESEEDPKLKILIAKLRAAFDSFGFPKTRYY